MYAAITPYIRPSSEGLQYYSAVPGEDVVGQPYRHLASDLQVSGEAIYVDDMKLPGDALHAALVLSTKPHAKIVEVDIKGAMEVSGVVGVYTARDVPGGNDIGAVIHDEELFASVGFFFVRISVLLYIYKMVYYDNL